jgi:hypothetical protein
MIIVMMVVGIGTLIAGLIAIAYGTWLELSLGNSLIVAGTVAACAGLILLGLCAVVAELRVIARRLADPRSAADARMRAGFPQIAPVTAQPAADAGSAYLQDPMARADAGHVAPSAAPPVSPPWHEENAAYGQGEAPPEPATASPATAAKSRRNLLFSSNLRKDRERIPPRVEPPVDSNAQPGPPASLPPAGAAEAPSPVPFDDAWPKPERASGRASDRPRGPEPVPQRRSARGSPYGATNGSAAADRQPPPARAGDPPTVTVIKSGVVDGMAYSLYSDGSIEAQMPEGMMRFASIDELRAHLDHRP